MTQYILINKSIQDTKKWHKRINIRFTYLKKMFNSLFLPLCCVDFLLKSCPPKYSLSMNVLPCLSKWRLHCPQKISQFQSIVLHTFLIGAFPTALTLVIATRLKYHKRHTCENIHTSHKGFSTSRSHTGFTTYISHTGCSTQNSQIGFINQKNSHMGFTA